MARLLNECSTALVLLLVCSIRFTDKKEPVVKGVHDDLIKPQMVSTLCFVTDAILMTNKLQVFLQASRLNFLLLPSQVEKLLGTLTAKFVNPSGPESYFFAKLDELFAATDSKNQGR